MAELPLENPGNERAIPPTTFPTLLVSGGATNEQLRQHIEPKDRISSSAPGFIT